MCAQRDEVATRPAFSHLDATGVWVLALPPRPDARELDEHFEAARMLLRAGFGDNWQPALGGAYDTRQSIYCHPLPRDWCEGVEAMQ